MLVTGNLGDLLGMQGQVCPRFTRLPKGFIEAPTDQW